MAVAAKSTNRLHIGERGHSKSTFAQDSRVLTPPSPLFRPCSLVRFRAPSPFPSRYVRFGQNSLSPLCLLRSHSGISIKWTPFVHDKSVRFIESPSKNPNSSKVNMKSTICHDFPSPDLLEEPKDEKIRENAKFLSF